MPTTSHAHAGARTSEKRGSTDRSERDQEVDAYIRGQLTVDEFLNTMDRRGSWIEQFLNRLAIHSPPAKRYISKRVQRVS